MLPYTAQRGMNVLLRRRLVVRQHAAGSAATSAPPLRPARFANIGEWKAVSNARKCSVGTVQACVCVREGRYPRWRQNG